MRLLGMQVPATFGQSSAIILHDALNDMVEQTLENTPPCQKTEVYFGPEGDPQ